MNAPMPTLRMLDRYLARGFLLAFLIILGVIVTLLQVLDLMNQADEILAPEGAGAMQVLQYVSMRAPQLADRFAPFVALLAAIFTLARLGNSSEITAMRAAGIAPLRVLAPLCATGAAIAVVHVAAHEFVVVPAQAGLARWEARDYAVDMPEARGDAIENLRYAAGGRIVRADALRRAGEGWALDNLRVYDMGEAGLISVLRADAARHEGGEGGDWTVTRGRMFDADAGGWSPAGERDWTGAPDPQALLSAVIEPERSGMARLREASYAASESAFPSPRLETALWHRFAAPAATIIMPLLAALAGFGLHRSNMLLPRVAAGVALGFAYFVIDNFMVVMGQLGALPAPAAVWITPALFLGVGLNLPR